MKALRFCMVTTFYPPHNFGGDGIAVQHLARGLVRRGHHVTVVYDEDAYASLSPRSASPPPPADDGVEVIALRSRMGALSPLLTQQIGRPVVQGKRLQKILQQNFDVVHFHNISLVGGPGVLSLASAASVRLYTAHEHWLVCPTHTLWRYQREPCTGRDCLRCSLSYRRPPQLWRNTEYLHDQAKHVDAFIALSEFSRAKHQEMGFRAPMEVLPLFLSDTAEVPTPSIPRHERPYFVFVGRLERLKGLRDVLPVFERYPHADLLIVGDGSDAPALHEAARHVPSIRFLGRLGPDAVRALVRDAVALIAPSQGYETFGLVLIEALREGTPVIARRVGPMPEIVDASQAGLLFENADELASAVRRMQEDEALRARCSQAGKSAFARLWSESAVLPRYLDLVERLRDARTTTSRSTVAAGSVA